MKKILLALLCGALLAVPASAMADPLVTVADPTPDGSFSGQYQCGWEMEQDEQGEWQYKRDENGQRIPVYCDQEGYVSVGPEGVVACNGNPDHTRPDNGDPLVGYVWIGPAYADSTPTAAAPGGLAGAGNHHETADGEPTGESPCP